MKYTGTTEKLADYEFSYTGENEETDRDDGYLFQGNWSRDIGYSRRGQTYYIIIQPDMTMQLYASQPDGAPGTIPMPDVILQMLHDGVIAQAPAEQTPSSSCAHEYRPVYLTSECIHCHHVSEQSVEDTTRIQGPIEPEQTADSDREALELAVDGMQPTDGGSTYQCDQCGEILPDAEYAAEHRCDSGQDDGQQDQPTATGAGKDGE